MIWLFYYPFSRSNSGMAGHGLGFADYYYQRCRNCSGETFALFLCRMVMVCNNHFTGYWELFSSAI